MDEATEIAFRIEWEGLEVEATCPPHMYAEVLGALGNEMLRLNAALEAQGQARAEEPTSEEHRA